MTQRAQAVLAGDRRAASRLITLAEAGDPSVNEDLRILYRAGGHARIIGITGPPGAGKSSLVDRIIGYVRATGRTIAVLAVDPSSPLSGGAVLGDRVRMHRHAEDAGVLIRSMAARGALGGLSHAAGDALTILDALKLDLILIETVGVGQSEIDVIGLADLVVLLQTAHGGDGVQSVKAGILEIADIIVVNKADTPGSDKMIHSLETMVRHRQPTAEGWETPVLATDCTAGTGVPELITAIDGFYACQAEHKSGTQRRHRDRMRRRMLTLAETALRQRVRNLSSAEALSIIDAAIARESDPNSAAHLLASLPGS